MDIDTLNQLLDLLQFILIGWIAKNKAKKIMGLFSAIGSIVTTSMTNKANAKEAAKSRDFTKEQALNSHQWEVSDLRKAGLNPILSANGGASMGSSAQATMQSPNVDGLDTAGLASSALDYKRLTAELDNVRADTSQKSSTEKVNSENLSTQKSQQAANLASAAAQASLSNLYKEQQRGQSLENDKQQVLKAPYDVAAPLVDRAIGGLKSTAKSAYDAKDKWLKKSYFDKFPHSAPSLIRNHLKGKKIMSRTVKIPYSRTRVQSHNPESKSRVIQSEAKFCDINHIVAKAKQTGQLPTLMGRQPLESFPSASSYQDMLNTVVAANQRFERLPSDIRNLFSNKPENMLAAIEMSQTDKNLASQLREIGLLNLLEEAPSAPTTLATEPTLPTEGGTGATTPK